MKKLRLDLDALEVDSFDPAPAEDAEGTVFGEQLWFTFWRTCDDPTCRRTCLTCITCQQSCLQPSCGITCHFTCGHASCLTCGQATCGFTCIVCGR